MTNLSSYLDEKQITQTEFARIAKTSVPTINRIAKGLMRPGLDLAHRIERASGGAIPTESWVADHQAAQSQ